MLRKVNLIAVLAALLLTSSFAIASTTVPLNTGYNHASFGPYAPVTGPSSTLDLYWINIASFPTTSPPVWPAYVIERHPFWALALLDTNWISARNTWSSAAGVNPENPGYTIFRKCFCLLPGYKDAKLSFDVRADDTIQVWLNTQVNQVLAPSWGHFDSAPLHAGTSNGFRVGKNCVYVLLEDYYGGAMGFDLSGSVSAVGLLPVPAAGTGQSFEPCACRSQGPVGVAGAASALKAQDDDREMIGEIVKLAEARRATKQMRLFQGEPTQLKVAPGRTDPIKRPNN